MLYLAHKFSQLDLYVCMRSVLSSHTSAKNGISSKITLENSLNNEENPESGLKET